MGNMTVTKGCKLCFCCLADGHQGEECFKSRVCGLNGCRSYHHRMLHEDRAEVKTPQNDSTARPDPPPTSVRGSAEEGETNERTHMTTTAMKLTAPSEFVALQTVPVYLASGGRQVKVRCYLNSDFAAELGLEGKPHELTVKVLNDNQEKLNSSIVEFTINSLDGRVHKQASAYTTE